MLSPKPRYVHSLPTYETLWIAPKDIASLESHRPPSIAETLRLRRISATTARPPVLLVHGLSAQSNTFEINEDPAGGLAAFLDAHYTVWLVDYRGSSCPEVLERLRVLSPSTRAGTFGFGATSLHDIARAIRVVHERHRHGDGVHVVAHCVGAGLLTLALSLDPSLPVANIVLGTLGLFYRAPTIRRLKLASMLPEYFAADVRAQAAARGDGTPPEEWIDPWLDWSKAGNAYRRLHEAQQEWEELDLGHVMRPPSGPAHFRRLSFIFGEPYLPSRLPGIDGEAGAATIKAAFGPMSISLMQDVAAHVRAGRPTIACLEAARGACLIERTPFEWDARPFIERHVTLFTGRHNRLWHPHSVATMHGWLRDAGASRKRLQQWILPGYGHQDLLWAASARHDVFERIATALNPGALTHPNPPATSAKS